MSLKTIINSFFLCIISYQNLYNFTILIDPIGDASRTGREIEDTFERVITLQCAQKLKETIENNFQKIQVILTRSAGESLTELQNASFANRINANLYLAISFYHQTSIPNNIAIFYYQENTMDNIHIYDPYLFYHISQAHLISHSITKNIAKIFTQVFQNTTTNSYFLPLGTFGIPCQPLFGIKCPAIYIEAGLQNKNDWYHIIEPIIATINAVLS